MIAKPLISIGMPAYNGEQYIRKALDSLLAQDYDNFELIISDNASTDATRKICREYADKDQRIRVYVQSRNIGAIANFKAVLEMAQGKYFMWAAVDDFWLPEFVSVLVNELETHSEAGVAMCAVDRVCEDGQLFDTIRFINTDNPNQRSYFQMLKGLTLGKKYNLFIYGLFRSPLLKQAMRLYPEVPGPDRLLICQLALATRFRYVDQVLHIRLHHEQPFNVREPDENFNRMQNEDKWVNVKMVHALGQILCRSRIIPWNRKLYLPVALWRYGWMLFGGRLKTYCPPSVWNQLMKVRRCFLLD
jgi:glycosyltransferase involved in cell wall biosynthesis